MGIKIINVSGQHYNSSTDISVPADWQVDDETTGITICWLSNIQMADFIMAAKAAGLIVDDTDTIPVPKKLIADAVPLVYRMAMAVAQNPKITVAQLLAQFETERG